MGYLSSSVADTVANIIQLDIHRADLGIAALCSAMLSIVIFSVSSWYFGIPTSESHALIAGITGAGIALGGVGVINFHAWSRVFMGLLLSIAAGFILGYALSLMLGGFFLDEHRSKRAQILSSAGMAFMHGAQDGQKFIAVFFMARSLYLDEVTERLVGAEKLAVMLILSLIMAMGTLTGGRRIITRIGGRMVSLDRSQGACADISGCICLLIASFNGIPMSTTHTKTASIIGAAHGRADLGVMRGIILAWGITFPACAAIGFLITQAIIAIMLL